MGDQMQISESAVLQPSGSISPRLDGHLYMVQREATSGNFIGLTVTDNDYKTAYWPTLKEAVTTLLLRDGADRISYEHNYSCVYKCVCNGYGDALYTDLHDLIDSLCAQMNNELHCSSSAQNNVQYLQQFTTSLLRVRDGLRGVVAIFNYFNRSYRHQRSVPELTQSLQQIIIKRYVDRQIQRVLGAMVECCSKPMSMDPALMHALARSLQELKPEYVQMRPQLFARFLPGVLPAASSINQLDAYRDEALRMQKDILTNPAFVGHCDVTRKRSFDESNAFDLQAQSQSEQPSISTPTATVSEASDVRVVSMSPDGAIMGDTRQPIDATTEPPRRIRVQLDTATEPPQVPNWPTPNTIVNVTAHVNQPNDGDTDMVDGLNNNGND